MEKNFTFEGQRPDEDVIFVLKQHPWVLTNAGVIGLILIVCLILTFSLWGLSAITSLIIVLIVFFGFVYGGYRWFLYNSYLYILTNQRIIILEQKSLFSRRLSETELDKIQNITVEVKGPVKTFLNFGNIKITTAGVDPVMVIENVENPYEVQQKIIKYSKKLTTNN
jgi:membrane protein YdbS with pleckstrin-like domain